MCGHFSNWWGFSFLIAQAFQLFNIAGYADMQRVMKTSDWDNSDSLVKPFYALALVSTICYFLVPVSVFIFNCKQMAFTSILLATLAFIVQMGIYTHWGFDNAWQFGVGWAGVGNSVVATIYMHFNEKVENE